MWMRQTDEVIIFKEKLHYLDILRIKPDITISYNYRFILPIFIISYPVLGSINLHISYLPYNKGADPNLWSHLEQTPPGVTIHRMDAGIDTGQIITQKLIQIPKEMTLESSYNLLQAEIKTLFKDTYNIIKSNDYKTYRHNGGTYHIRKQKPELKDGWNTRIRDLQTA